MAYLNQCKGCGLTFEAKQARTKTCSEACRERVRWWAANDHPPYAHTCERCGSEYAAVKRTQRFCSTRCRNAASTLARSDLTCCDCGDAMFNGPDSKPQGEARCRSCRKANPSPKGGAHPCPDCGTRCYGERCHPCQSKRQIVRAPDDVRLVRKQREHAAPGIRPCDRDRLRATWKRQGKRCAYCPNPADTIDHVVPLVRGGTNYEGNLVPCCKSCNSSKQGLTIVEWRTGKRLPRMTKAPQWKRKTQPIKAIKGEQLPMFTVATCQECGCAFTPFRKGLKYCGTRCMVAAHRRLNRTRYRLKAGIDPESPYQAGREGWARVTPRRAA